VKVAIGADHAGFHLKGYLAQFLEAEGIACIDVGTHTEDPTDYPDVTSKVGRAVLDGEADLGIMICGTGVGSCIAANKMRGIRAAHCHDTYSARMSRSHNDANVLCLGERVIGACVAREIVSVWLATTFSGEERHQRRLGKVGRLEAGLADGE
jgi:ribose 5-phosphate isomerase B